MIEFYCSKCGHKMSVGDEYAGRSGKCRNCNFEIVVPGGSPVLISEPPPVRYEARTALFASNVLPGHDPDVPTVNMNVPTRSNSLGIASLILGILAFVICWIPFVNVISVLLGLLGLLLGVIGLFVSFSRRGASIGYPIAGVAINGLAVGFAIFMLSIIGNAVNKAAETSKNTAPSSTSATMSEFQRIHEGMTYEEVTRIIGSKGEVEVPSVFRLPRVGFHPTSFS